MVSAVILAVALVLLYMVIDKWRKSRRRRTADPARLPPIAGEDDPSIYTEWGGHMRYFGKVAREPRTYALAIFERFSLMSQAPIATVFPFPRWLGGSPLFVVRGEKEAKEVAVKGGIGTAKARDAARMMAERDLGHQVRDKAGFKYQTGRLSAGLRRHTKLETTALRTAKHVHRLQEQLKQQQCSSEQPGERGFVIEDTNKFFARLIMSAYGEILSTFDLWSPSITEAQREEFFSLNDVIFDYLGKCVNSLFSAQTRRWLHPFEYRNMRHATTRLVNEWYMPGAEKRLAELQDGEEVPDDFLSSILDDNAPGASGPAFDCSMAAQMSMMLMETADTIAGSLQWAVLTLTQNPEAQDKCYEEIVSVIGEVPEEDRPTCRDLDDMPYLIGAIKEALRVRTVTTVFARSIPDDLNVGDYTLPAGSMAIIIPNLYHLSEKNFANAMAYLPERWVDDPITGGAKDGRETLSYSPFGFGPNRCFGEAIAQVMMKVILAHLLRAYRFELASPIEDAYYTMPNFTPMPHRVAVRFVPRD